MKATSATFYGNKRKGLLWCVGLFVALIIAALTYTSIVLPVILVVLCVVSWFCILVFNMPKTGVFVLLGYCFLYILFIRELSGSIPFGIGIEAILVVTTMAVLFRTPRTDWRNLNRDLFFLMLIWFIISVIEIGNPAGANVRGWLQEIRSTALYPLFITFLGLLLFKTEADLNTFFWWIFALSLLASMNGLKQQYIGLSPGESRFLAEGGAVTHVLFGRLRIFSFYTEAAQFGASQAHFSVMALILALGPFKWWKKAFFAAISLLFFYGMLLSGTRGALFALVVSVFFAIFLSKNFKVLIIGTGAALLFLGFLKFTSIGNGNYEIYRLRTALDPQDASLNVRFLNQQKLRDYLSTRPFGGGLGVIGTNGKEYNADKFLSTIEPDSYWVKVWAMYGIIGFTIWFCIMMYLFGRSSRIIWSIKDPRLRVKLIALVAGSAGIFFCSYGNEVMNTMPSAILVYLSFVFVFISPAFDKLTANQVSTSGIT